MLSWQNSLRARLAKRPRKDDSENRPYRIAVLGIGNELRGDDAAGVIVARELSVIASGAAAKQSLSDTVEIASAQTARLAMTSILIIETGAVPEAFTGQLRRFEPDLVLMIDAAQLNEPPGTIRLIEWQDTVGLSASTHSLPLNVIAQYLINELRCEVIIIGLQSEANAFDTPLSPVMRRTVDEVTLTLAALLTSISA